MTQTFHTGAVMRASILVVATAILAACGGTSRTDTMKTLAEEQTVSAQKDSMLQEISSNASFIAEVSRQLGTVRSMKTGRTPVKSGDLEEPMNPSQRRTMILAQVKEITERLNQSEQRLSESRRRVVELTGSDASKSKRLAAFDSVANSFRQIIDSQRSQIADLTAEVQKLQEENTALKSDNTRLASTTTQLTVQRDSLVAEQNTVYYVTGTRADLTKRGVIQSVGGFLGLGKTPVAARVLDPSQFTPVDMRTVKQIELPDTSRKYKIITRQNVAALATPPDAKGYVHGTVSIREPQQFWAGSKYLILVSR
jgi:regulator of replication initiation timing